MDAQNRRIDVSVITPCYNCASTVEETLRSTECEDYDGYEVIVVDDGSTDDTVTLVRGYADTVPTDMRIIQQPNAGVSAARNTGIRASRGRYLIFLDSDDVLAEGYIPAVAKVMNGYGPDTMSCYSVRDIRDVKKVGPIEGHIFESDPAKILMDYTYSKLEYGMASFVYRRELLEKYDLWFTEGAKYGEDWEFATKYLARCHTMRQLDYNYFYRVRNDSVSTTINYSQVDAMNAAERTSAYLTGMGHPFAKRYEEYMYNKALFSVAHRFAKGRRKDLYDRLHEEYPVREAMRFAAGDNASGVKAQLAAKAYLVSPRLFYLVASLG